MVPCLASQESSCLKPSGLLENLLFLNLSLRKSATSNVFFAMSMPKTSIVFIVETSEVMKIRFVQVHLVNTSSSSRKRLQIPYDLCEQTEERELIYGAGSLAARSYAASSFP